MVAFMNPGNEVPDKKRRRLRVFSVAILTATTLSACSTDVALPPTSTTGTTLASEPTATTTIGTTSTPTSVNPSTTTTSQVGACRPDPFEAPFPDQLSQRYPGKQITAFVYDTRTGCDYRLNPSNRQPTASVFKVMVMAGTLFEVQEENRELSDWELGQLTPMITQSTNPQVRRLWSSFGSSPWFRQQAEIFGLDETVITADGGSAWGRTKTSAADQVWLLRQLLLGETEVVQPGYRAVALSLMTSVVPEQTWGVTAGVPASWVVAQKNGFAGATTNSVGWVDEPGPGNGYLVAILSTGWPNFATGIPAVEYVNQAIADAMFDTIADAE